jgi:glycosyltransferase involved in cell wall biosynthesis
MNSLKNIKVSIIVPIYNVEAYLDRCLDSLVNQTLKDIEIICVNDCSPDNSLAILKRYANKDQRIKIINFEKNQGVSVARNSGMKIAQGKYIGLVDPDDYVDLDFYEKLYLKAKETDADIVYAGYKSKALNNVKEYIYPIKKARKKYFLPHHHCEAIYRVDFLRNNFLEYPAGIKLSQDVIFVVKAVFFANRIELVDDVFYHYVIREKSSSESIGENIHKSYGISLVFDFINETIINREGYEELFKWFFEHMIHLFMRVVPEWRYIFAQDIVKIYKNRKYPVVLKNIPKSINTEILENAEKLYNELEKELKYGRFYQYPKIEINDLQNRKLYIWGAGYDGVNALIQCENNGWQVEAFLDSNSETAKFQGEYKIITPQEILIAEDKNFFIIISSRNFADEIAKICEKAGLKEGRDYWRPK